MKSVLAFFLIFLVTTGSSIAQNSKPAAINSQGLDQAKLPDTIVKAIDQIFAEYDNTRSPGGAVGVVMDGKLIFARGYGMANLEHDIPITPETVFRIGSTSKQVTAGAIALLEQQGVLSLDDPIRKWIPELPDYASGITLKHLLHHTSGIRDYLILMEFSGYGKMDWYSDEEALEVLARQRALNFEPGTDFLYSNSGYFLLSKVIERATGQTLAEYAEEYLFRPLGMENTHFHNDPVKIVSNRATGYSPTEDGRYRINVTTLPMIGDGGVFTTIEDMALWAQNLAEPKVGGKKWLEVMLKSGVLSSGDTTNYALGLYYGEHRGLRTVGHSGSWVGYLANLTRFPDHDLTIITFFNRSDADPIHLSFQTAELFLSKYLSEKSVVAKRETEGATNSIELDPRLFDKFAGRYELEAQPGFILEFSREGDTFYIQGIGQRQIEIVPTSTTTFDVKGVDASVTFHIGKSEKTDSLTLHQNGENLAHRVEPWSPTEADLEAYTGRYFSKELQTFYTVAEKGSGLVIQHRRMEEIPLTPMKEDTFHGEFPISQIIFIRTEAGQVSRLLVSNPATRGIPFEKVLE